MSLIEEYYELNEAEEVAAIWKILQIGFYGASAGLGLWCGFTMATLRLKFGDRCYLFTKVNKSVKQVETVNDIDWESDTWCDYYQFTFVSSFIVGIIWAAFFLMCGKGGRSLTGLPQPWRIIWPSLIFNLAFFLIILGTSTRVQAGTYRFCTAYKEQVKNYDNCLPRNALVHRENFEMTEFQMSIVPKTAWGCTMCWLTLFLLSLFRIVFLVDFRMYRICVFRIDDAVQNKREEVLKVTNYEEPKRLHFSEDADSVVEEILETAEPQGVTIVEIPQPPIEKEVSAAVSQIPHNTGFYQRADRRLGKQRKSRSISKPPDTKKMSEESRRKASNESAKSDSSTERPIFRKYSKHGHETDREDDESPVTTAKVSFKDERKKSDPEAAASDSSFDPSHSLTFKKQI